MDPVELHPAHVWDCPECGIENFCRCVFFEPDAQDMEMGIEQGMWLTAPDQVTCTSCATTFDCEDMK
jgi:hypothetical protein